MTFMSIRDLRSTRRLTSLLKEEERVVVTNNSKPIAVMIEVDETSLEDTLFDIRKIRAQRALREVQRQSVHNGTDTLTMAEIDEEIRLARTERKQRL
jgi:PHD/YefM family antitoxin component YafN of YafNO toxin-antitoxin module